MVASEVGAAPVAAAVAAAATTTTIATEIGIWMHTNIPPVQTKEKLDS
jgi:hypothetical protein